MEQLCKSPLCITSSITAFAYTKDKQKKHVLHGPGHHFWLSPEYSKWFIHLLTHNNK
jgi:hypothetical protein